MSPKHIAGLARAVLRDPQHIGVLSTGERCAVALVINRLDLLPAGYTALEAIVRVEGGGWPLEWLVEAANSLGLEPEQTISHGVVMR